MITERRELEGQAEPEVRQPLLKHLGLLGKGNDTHWIVNAIEVGLLLSSPS